MFKKYKNAMKDSFQAVAAVVREVGLCVSEYTGHVLDSSIIAASTPKGDGHPVLFVPGFMESDAHLQPLSTLVKEQGYKTYSWEGGRNLGLSEKTAKQLKKRLHEIYAETGEKVSLVGHSLGGLFSRELAREFPHMVRDVITLGSPFANIGDQTAIAKPIKAFYSFLNPENIHCLEDQDMIDRFTTPPPVPVTSILSGSDPVVHSKHSLNPSAPQTQNIQIKGSSHTGMPWKPSAELVVLDRLSQTPDAWQPFKPEKYAAWVSEVTIVTTDLPVNPDWSEEKGKKDYLKPLFRH